MNTNELLHAISDIMDQKLEEKIVPRIANLENSLNDNVIPRLNNMENSLNNNVIPRLTNLEENLIPRVANLEENLIPRVINIELRIENELIPRISNIEDCYISTFERYQKGIDQLDEMQHDIEVIKATVTGHSEELNKFTGPYLVK